jgi:hypothetical protein
VDISERRLKAGRLKCVRQSALLSITDFDSEKPSSWAEAYLMALFQAGNANGTVSIHHTSYIQSTTGTCRHIQDMHRRFGNPSGVVSPELGAMSVICLVNSHRHLYFG